ncbi:MAG: tetratricopeptide repeat protein [Cyanobacteria bacterium P01_F01_bin.42]
MDQSFVSIYLVLLLVLLGAAAIFIFRQVFRTRRIEKNLNTLQNKLSKSRGNTQEYFEMGSIMLSKKLHIQAVSLFQKAIKQAKKEGEEEVSPIYNALGYAYFAQEQYDLAIKQYKEALDRDPTYVTAFNNLGHAYEKKNLGQQALQAYENALALDEKNAIAKKRAQSLRRRLVIS